MTKKMNILQKLKNPDYDFKDKIILLSFSLSFILLMISGVLGVIFPASLLVDFLLVFSVNSFIASLVAINVADAK